MKQKSINYQGSPDGNEMLNDYWAVEIRNDAENFILTDEEFNKKYQGLYCYSELDNATSYAVYEIKNCDTCDKTFEVIINNRAHLHSYQHSKYKLCRHCNHLHNTVRMSMGIQLDGEVAS